MSMKLYVFKAPPDLMDKVDHTLARFIHTRKGKPLNRSEFIRRAIEKDLLHLERSRKPRGKRGR